MLTILVMYTKSLSSACANVYSHTFKQRFGISHSNAVKYTKPFLGCFGAFLRLI